VRRQAVRGKAGVRECKGGTREYLSVRVYSINVIQRSASLYLLQSVFTAYMYIMLFHCMGLVCIRCVCFDCA